MQITCQSTCTDGFQVRLRNNRQCTGFIPEKTPNLNSVSASVSGLDPQEFDLNSICAEHGPHNTLGKCLVVGVAGMLHM